MTLMTPVSRLTSLPYFRDLDSAAVARLSASVTEFDARSGTVLFRRGEPSGELYFVVHGQVKLALDTPQGGERVVELVGPGGCFGESGIFLDRPHLLTAETLAQSRLATLPKAAVLAELPRTPEFTRNIIASLSRRLQYLIGTLEDCTLRSGTERVIGYLLNQRAADAADGEVSVTLPVKKGIIASQLNLTHEHFSRILRGLVTNGLIHVRGRNVHLRDMGRLHARLSGGG